MQICFAARIPAVLAPLPGAKRAQDRALQLLPDQLSGSPVTQVRFEFVQRFCASSQFAESYGVVLRPHDLGAIFQWFVDRQKFGDALEYPPYWFSLRPTQIWLGRSVRYGDDLVVGLVEVVGSDDDGVFPDQKPSIRIVVALCIELDESQEVGPDVPAYGRDASGVGCHVGFSSEYGACACFKRHREAGSTLVQSRIVPATRRYRRARKPAR